MLNFSRPATEKHHAQEHSSLTPDDPSAFAPPPAFGPFRVLHQVGVGALGPVFRTYEPSRDRLVAVKVFRLDITPEQARALADELSTAAEAGLFHPSIVEPIASGVEGTVAYRADEYVAAESLDVAMRHYAPAPLDKVLPFISQLAAAIDFARLNGIGHGALHPRDIFVTPDEARATGFGIVEALERVGLRAPVRRPYSAPERVEGAKWGTAADVFSLGAIAYELLTGRRPAGVGAGIGDLSGASVGEQAEPVRAALVRAMEENPDARFPTAMAFAGALEAASRGESVAVTAAVPPVPAGGRREATGPPEGGRYAREGGSPEGGRYTPEIDDITPEKDEDEAFFTLAREGRDTDTAPEQEQERDLFDAEAIEDLALAPPPPRFTDDFDSDVLGEPQPPGRFSDALASESEPQVHKDDHVERYRDTEPELDETDDDDVPEHVSPPRRSIDYVSDDAYEAAELPRRRTLPGILLVLLGMIVGIGLGFAGGYGFATRPSSTPDATEAEATEKTGSGTPAEARPYSDQAVTPSTQKPPSDAPPIPGDAPPPVSGTPPAASAPASGATASSGRLIVRSVPSNAGVTVDGTWRGRTPLTLDNLRLGSHEVRVVQPGFAVATQSVALTASAPSRTLSFRLRSDGAASSAPTAATPPAPTANTPVASAPARPTVPPAAPEARGPGSLYVDSRPRGAAVFLNGRQVGVTPAVIPDVTPGPHVIRLQLPEHRVWTANTQVLAGQQTRVTGSLERIQ